ncbi:hypothetical protein D5086_033944 [Populus alba]|uniref:Uncharacterized protein n=1 Tax=Populus alba TaxID=43335 RepID=A0ACC4AIA4_POPAL
MIRDSGDISFLGMPISRTWTFGAALLIWLCWSSVLVAAQDAPTDPVEVKALRDIKNSLIDINNNLSNWRQGDPCTSNWTGVLCFNTTKEDGYQHVRELQLLNMNLSGTLSPSLGRLSYMEILDFMWNNITGNIPPEIGNITSLVLFHMNNNSISGQIPAELSRLPSLLHFLLDNNNLSGSLPPELANFPNILILDLSYNNLNGTIPANFSGLPLLQQLSIANNSLSGSVPFTIWQTRANGTEGLDLDFENNTLSNISGSISLPQNVTLWLKGNPACSNSSIGQFCESRNSDMNNQSSTESNATCLTQSCPPPYEYSPTSLISCFCAAPLIFGYRLKSPGFSNFIPYRIRFENYLTSGLELSLYQLDLASVAWESGPRLYMHLKLFPVYVNENSSHVFNTSEARRIISMFTGWKIPDNEIFGPYELLYITLLDPYVDVIATSQKSNKISTGALVGIVLGAIAGAVTLSAVVSLLILRRRLRDSQAISKRRRQTKASMKIEGVKDFSYAEMAMATNNFNSSSQVGQGGYGKVYKGILANGRTVAIKRTEEGSLQGEKEFLTEIELLSRLHHRNLVSLLGYCDERGEQMLVYEFMPNGTLRDHLSVKGKEPLSFATRLKIAMTSAKGILYLHTEADPPIFHRDIKASNILVDSRYDAKVADFGLSRLAPVPDIEGSVPDHISTVVKGTPGYLDPEYFLTHKLTDKSDVYSLGVVFLELLTGKQPISHGKNIVREVKVAYQSGMIFSVIDERMGSYPSDCVDKFLTLAMKCCNEETDARPSMADVVRELEGIWHMMSESDTTTTVTISTDNGKEMTPPSSSSMMMNPCVSSEVSGSDLVSGAVPTITPR